MSKAIYRSATDHEKDMAAEFCRCSFPCGSFVKRFARQLGDQVATTGEITDKQANRLAIESYRYRRQMPGRLVPKSPPDGYMTTKQRTDAAIAQAKINQMKEEEEPTATIVTL
jgi:hypothetical protein